MWFHLVCVTPIVCTFPFLKGEGVSFNYHHWRRGSESYLNQANIDSTNQINLIKFVESKKLDKVYSKIWNIFVWSNFLKIWHALIHQISWLKNIKSNFKSLQRRKNEENRTTNESAWNIFVARFSFDVLASLIFVIYFTISLFTSTNNSLKHSGIILSFVLLLF